MPGSAVADIQATYGATLIGLLVSTVCVVLLPPPPLADTNSSLYGVTLTQM